MEFRAFVLLTLLGCLSVESTLGQRGDMDIGARLRELMAKVESMKHLEAKLNETEKLQSDLEALEARLNATIDELTEQRAETDRLKKENKDMQMRLNATEEEIEKLKQSGGKADPQVAFSTSLANSGEVYKGPCTDKTLVFKQVFSNTGNGYDQNTGIFTAPVNGLYYFSFSTYGYNTHLMGAILMKNGIRQVSTYEDRSADGSDSSSNAVILQLADGDEVYMELWENARVFDNLNGHTTFSGFLLFPM
uniref:cerebellin-1-like n=1 Tax=Centroberyx gerrardi TaxID=166262 RepID=UPI003AAFF27E